jgi:hypothetical protein
MKNRDAIVALGAEPDVRHHDNGRRPEDRQVYARRAQSASLDEAAVDKWRGPRARPPEGLHGRRCSRPNCQLAEGVPVYRRQRRLLRRTGLDSVGPNLAAPHGRQPSNCILGSRQSAIVPLSSIALMIAVQLTYSVAGYFYISMTGG